MPVFNVNFRRYFPLSKSTSLPSVRITTNFHLASLFVVLLSLSFFLSFFYLSFTLNTNYRCQSVTDTFWEINFSFWRSTFLSLFFFFFFLNFKYVIRTCNYKLVDFKNRRNWLVSTVSGGLWLVVSENWQSIEDLTENWTIDVLGARESKERNSKLREYRESICLSCAAWERGKRHVFTHPRCIFKPD